jgi:L-alanine-DL-glutamate epimerase-like enolase superfamily enzyme
MQVSLYPYQLKFKHPFKIAHGKRSGTDVVFVKIEHDGFTAWGEAALPPYLDETQQSVIDFISNFAKASAEEKIDTWFEKLNNSGTDNMAAKAALDIALWSLRAQTENKSIMQLAGIVPVSFPLCTYTLGVGTKSEMEQKINEALDFGFELFKLKLDGEQDEETINHFTKICHKPYLADVNQGWKNAAQAIEKITWLAGRQCIAVEQPLKKELIDEMRPVKQNSPIPVYADESCQAIGDIDKLKDSFHGINIKLMKCGGISPAIGMIKRARQLGLQVLIGCMSESSVGCTAAANLTPLADYADLDGPYLLANDPFSGMHVEGGRIAIHNLVQVVEL